MRRAILLFGYPGCGKGTQGRILNALPGFCHVGMGDVLRGIVPGHPLYDEVQGHIRGGNLVPDDLVMQIFARHVTQMKLDPDEILVLDGIPRSQRQVDLLKQQLQVVKIFKLSVYDENLVIERLRKRARAEGRVDDASDEVIHHRLRVYREQTESCVRAYPGTMLTRIQADQPVFDVHFDIITALRKLDLAYR